MSDNVLQTLQQLIQDVIAPDVRELKVRVGSIEKQIEALNKRVEQRFDSLYHDLQQRFTAADQRNEAQFKAVMAAISEIQSPGRTSQHALRHCS